MTSAVTSASDGTFSLTGKYSAASCSATTQVYITATGGNPGLSSTNSALALMAALGSCTALTSSVPTISINEVSTVAAVYALQQFMGVSEGTPDAEDIAVNSTQRLSAQSTTGMINAFATVPNLVSLSTGAANATLGNSTMEASKLNTIANIISYCVNSNGGSAVHQSVLGGHAIRLHHAGRYYPGSSVHRAEPHQQCHEYLQPAATHATVSAKPELCAVRFFAGHHLHRRRPEPAQFAGIRRRRQHLDHGQCRLQRLCNWSN